MDSNNLNFSDYIKEALKNKILSKSDMANTFQVAETTIDRWAAGTAIPLEAMQKYVMKYLQEIESKKNHRSQNMLVKYGIQTDLNYTK